MKTTLFSTAVALVTLTTASSAFAGDGWRLFSRDSYSAPVTRPQPTYPQPTYQPSDYRPEPTYRPSDDYRPVRKPRRDGY